MEINGVNPSFNSVKPPTVRVSAPTITLFPETVLSHATILELYHFDLLEECGYIVRVYLMGDIAADGPCLHPPTFTVPGGCQQVYGLRARGADTSMGESSI